jgi:hypothetical protein
MYFPIIMEFIGRILTGDCRGQAAGYRGVLVEKEKIVYFG